MFSKIYEILTEFLGESKQGEYSSEFFQYQFNIEERDNRKRKICEENKIKLVYLYNKKDEKFVPKNDGYNYFYDPQILINYIAKCYLQN